MIQKMKIIETEKRRQTGYDKQIRQREEIERGKKGKRREILRER
jgi:hypothetical protein